MYFALTLAFESVHIAQRSCSLLVHYKGPQKKKKQKKTCRYFRLAGADMLFFVVNKTKEQNKSMASREIAKRR